MFEEKKSPKKLSIDNLRNKETFTFTLNPSDKYQYFKEMGRTVKSYIAIRKKLEPLREYAKFELYPEYSFPANSSKTSRGPRLHYHGTIEFNDVVGFLEMEYFRLSQSCVFEIDILNDVEVWNAYKTKNMVIMKEHFKFRKLPYPLTDKNMKKEVVKKMSFFEGWVEEGEVDHLSE